MKILEEVWTSRRKTDTFDTHLREPSEARKQGHKCKVLSFAKKHWPSSSANKERRRIFSFVFCFSTVEGKRRSWTFLKDMTRQFITWWGSYISFSSRSSNKKVNNHFLWNKSLRRVIKVYCTWHILRRRGWSWSKLGLRRKLKSFAELSSWCAGMVLPFDTVPHSEFPLRLKLVQGWIF